MTAAGTPTPTSEPGLANLNLRVKFEGIDDGRAGGKTVRVVFKKGESIIDTREASVSHEANGVYLGTVASITPDTYDLFIKGWAHLQKGFANVTLNPGENSPVWPDNILLAGDANTSGESDNRVDSADFNQLALDYLQTESLADFNLDGRVDSTDFDLLAGNWLKVGEE